ncbi:hypothetical protein V5E97_16885 [Singulisphaera sp. Ch08]|uniref:Carboxypeptidase regulatory-like domain-containing protein n=1 Tax=Singulisphaera sp. Ch08 TaxID=3120278 RepID=A0AAU7CQU7_9BACT
MTTSSLAVAIVVISTGCGDRPPSVSTSRTEATVRGKVLIKGKAVDRGKVVFDAANHLRKDVTGKSVDVNKDGTYSITTLLGVNSVRYEGPALAGSRELEGMSLSYDVKEGDNLYDIIIPPQ